MQSLRNSNKITCKGYRERKNKIHRQRERQREIDRDRQIQREKERNEK